MVRSNDLHEIRAYDRAIHLARGDVVCILQDDDIPPPDGRWVDEALALFDAHPGLAILGGFQGRFFGEGKVRFGSDYAYSDAADRIPHVDPKTGIPFSFVHGVNIGPIFMKRNLYFELGGFDYGLSAPGEPGIHSDYEICLRAWLRGYHVGLYSAPFERRAGVPGTLVYGLDARERRAARNEQRLEQIYWHHLPDYSAEIEKLNTLLTTLPHPSSVPGDLVLEIERRRSNNRPRPSVP